MFLFNDAATGVDFNFHPYYISFDRVSIMGHSMGGHGALTIALKNSSQYRYVRITSLKYDRPIPVNKPCMRNHATVPAAQFY